MKKEGGKEWRKAKEFAEEAEKQECGALPRSLPPARPPAAAGESAAVGASGADRRPRDHSGFHPPPTRMSDPFFI